MNKKKIQIEVTFDEDNLPLSIDCFGDDIASENEALSSKTLFLGLFNKELKDTMKLSLWTKDMTMMEMDRFTYYTIRSITDMYQRATNNRALANEMERFAHYFGQKTEIIPPEE
jgi:gliding motility-associated protein GldC